jgi:hypothetical protein
MRHVVLAVALILAGWRADAHAAQTLYVDCSSAAAKADGSLQWPLNRLEQLNALRLQPGTRVLFKRGMSCHGSFKPQAGSSGKPGAPIVVDAYGDRALGRPVIAAGCRATQPDPDQSLTEARKTASGISPYYSLCTADDGLVRQAALHLVNVEHWEINSLELSNDGVAEAGRVGLLVQLEDFGIGHHYRINDVYVHHVRGYLQDTPGRELAYKETGGILFTVTRTQERPGSKQKKTSFDDVVIENSEVYQVDGIGVSNRSAWMCRQRGAPCGDFAPYKGNAEYMKATGTQAASDFFPSTGIVIRNNKIHNIGGDGLIVRTAVAPRVEANLLYDIWMRAPGNSAGAWAINTDDALFQYNEVYGVRHREEIEPGDGMAFDADMGTRNTRFHANYSHDNAGGMMLFCACGRDGLGNRATAEGVLVESNLSINDGRRAIMMAGVDTALVKDNLIVANGTTALIENGDFKSPNAVELHGNQFINTSNQGVMYRTKNKEGSYAAMVWGENSFHGYPASTPADGKAEALVERWFASTGFRENSYQGKPRSTP